MSTKPTNLDLLAKKINAGHKKVLASFRTSVQHAKQVGLWLLEAKEQLVHGQWQKWVKKNCRFSYETAANYIRVASNEKEVNRNLQRNADLSLSEMLQSLVRARKPKHAKKTISEGADNEDSTHKEDSTAKDNTAAPGNSKQESASTNGDQTNKAVEVLNETEAGVLLAKMQQYNIKAAPEDVMAFITDVLGIGVNDVVNLLQA
jgi:hypothetical protein